ncbi:ATP-binding protein [Athalassotoga sp.]|uniref:ATP-binding protein n=1 Tax=Athalassotoga sp. TaxID=2022597 RepID=UPI003CFED108
MTDELSKNMVFALECPLYKSFYIKEERSIRAKEILGYLFYHSFENFSPQFNPKAFEIAKEYVSHKAWENGSWLIFHGAYGVGKTHLLSAIIKEAIISFGTKAKFLNLAKVSTLGFEEAKEELRNLSDYELIALDDIGIEISQNWLIPYIFKIFDDFNMKGGIIMSTNLSLKALQNLLGDRISDRIAENAIAIEMKGQSMRQNLRNNKISWIKKGDDLK